MNSIAQLAATMQKVLGERANEVARVTGFMERERVLTGSSFVVGLVSTWMADPASSLAGLSQGIGNAGTPISRQGLNARFDGKAVRFLAAMVQECMQAMVQTCPAARGILARFSAVDVVDSTIITLPNALREQWAGSGGYGDKASTAAMKVSVRWDVSGGMLTQLDITNGITHDRHTAAAQAPVATDSLQIRDLGYFKLDDLAAIDQQGANWLTRYKPGTTVLSAEGQVLALPDYLPQQPGHILDEWVLVGKDKQLPARLIAERVPPTVVAQRHARIRETARQNQTTPSQRSLTLAHWTLYLTNVPAHRLTPDEVLVLGRYRWQIELLFKLWKSELLLDEWCTDNPTRILCEIFAKLIAAMVTHWLLLVSCWDNPRRSLHQAMPTLRGLAWQWANSLFDRRLLTHALHALKRALTCCRMEPSQQHPRAFQLLEPFYA
jgi:hypothetical protein